ncbi:UNVERIFIED_CONTAM: hypothetical protein FKN15_021181 [Acipenser sinensis]
MCVQGWGVAPPSGASSKGTVRGVQDLPFSFEVASSNPGYVIADRGRESPEGGAHLAKRCPGGVMLKEAMPASQ